jgi:hypothetical protein
MNLYPNFVKEKENWMKKNKIKIKIEKPSLK